MRRSKPAGKWVFVPDTALTPDELERKNMDEVTEMLGIGTHLSRAEHPFAAAEEFQNYFPGRNKVPDGGGWILVKSPPNCEYTVPPLSLWFAEPWPITPAERHCSHRVKIMTPKGELGLFPREYSLVDDPGKYYEFVGDGMDLKFFGSNETAIPRELADKLFYIRSRGVSKADALLLLMGSIKAHVVHAVRNSMQDSAINQSDCVANMIREELDKCLKDPAAVWANMLRGTIARPQALEHYEECKEELEQVQNALDNYWREHFTTVDAVQAVMKDVNDLRIRLSQLRTEVNCRIEHGAESGGHLEYIQKQLDTPSNPVVKEGL